jgi:hypothetical protein
MREVRVLAGIASLASLLSCRPAAIAPQEGPSAAEVKTNDPAAPVAEARACSLAPGRDAIRDALVEASHLATGRRADEAKLDEWTDTLCSASRDQVPQALAGIVDQLTKDPGFSRLVAPRIHISGEAFSPSRYVLLDNWILKQFKLPDGREANYLRTECGAKDVVAVRSWWDDEKDILICKDDYRPEVFGSKDDVIRCTGSAAAPGHTRGDICGCGPQLLRCFPSKDVYKQVNNAIVDEVMATFAQSVEEETPYRKLFSRPDTYRDRYAEFMYRRGLLEEGQLGKTRLLPTAAEWPDKKWANRWPNEEQHAGVLTATNIVFTATARRSNQKRIYDMMWCNRPESSGVDAVTMLKATAALGPVRDIRNNINGEGSGWKHIAHMPKCNVCHARLDYSSQFFVAYPDTRRAAHIHVPPKTIEVGELFGDDDQDLRTKLPRTPKNFGQFMVAQPEFRSCTAQKINQHLFGFQASPEDQEVVKKAIAKEDITVRGLWQPALVHYVVKRLGWEKIESQPDDNNLTALIEENCTRCHQSPDPSGGLDLEGPQSKAVLAKVLDYTAYRRMPPEGEPALTPETHRAMVSALIGELFGDSPEKRREAELYYVEQMRSIPLHRLESLRNIIERSARGKPESWRKSVELGISSERIEMSPNMIALTSLEAVRSCKKSTDGRKLEDCVAAAMAAVEFEGRRRVDPTFPEQLQHPKPDNNLVGLNKDSKEADSDEVHKPGEFKQSTPDDQIDYGGN